MKQAPRPPGREHRSAERRPGGTAPLRPRHRRPSRPDPAVPRHALYRAFGESEVSVIYTQLNQYYVVMEVAPKYWQDPSGLNNIYLKTAPGSGAGVNSVAPLFTTMTAPNQHHAAAGQPHRPVPVGHRLLQPGQRLLALRRHPRDHPDGAKPGHAIHRARLLRRHRPGLPAVALQRKVPRHHRAARRLHRPRHPL